MMMNYLLCAGFMLIILLIIGKKAYSDIKQSKSRHSCLWLISAIAVYVLMDALFIVYYTIPFQVSIYKLIAFVFYVVYVVVPFIWHEFMRNFVHFTQKNGLEI